MQASSTDQLLAAWRVHNEVNLFLIGKIPSRGFQVVPLQSRGRSITDQLVHMHNVRLGWLHYHTTGKRLTAAKLKKNSPKTRAQCMKAFRRSGKLVEEFIERAITEKATVRLFNKSPVRWMAYLISHESHHRGSIVLALKQNGMRMKEDVAIQGLWGKWLWGKPR